jgi:hypothetical protein
MLSGHGALKSCFLQSVKITDIPPLATEKPLRAGILAVPFQY